MIESSLLSGLMPCGPLQIVELYALGTRSNDCNNAITIPKLKKDIKLSAGDNLIEFTPLEEGEITYTCWMGMIKSRITVVGDLGKN